MGWPKLLRPPSGLTGSSPSRSYVPSRHFLPGRTPVGKAEIFHQHEFGWREAVMDFGHGDLSPRVGHASLCISIGSHSEKPR